MSDREMILDEGTLDIVFPMMTNVDQTIAMIRLVKEQCARIPVQRIHINRPGGFVNEEIVCAPGVYIIGLDDRALRGPLPPPAFPF